MRRWIASLVVLLSAGLAQLCDQPFSPLREGWVWEYRLLDAKGQSAGNVTARKVLYGNSFVTQLRGSDANGGEIRNDTRYVCTPEGIRTAGEGLGGDGVTVRSIKVSGIEIPEADAWQVGASWQQKVEIEGEGRFGVLPVSGRMTLETTFRIAAQEAVAVPAGRFNAFRVESLNSLRFQTSIPLPLGSPTFRATYWYALDVGVVKTVFGNGNDLRVSELLRLPRR
ncbi:MAG: hypothetical protein SFU83_01475 [Meiothermus sp.]|nr:hypothetical protein [Meiothermus sp.]